MQKTADQRYGDLPLPSVARPAEAIMTAALACGPMSIARGHIGAWRIGAPTPDVPTVPPEVDPAPPPMEVPPPAPITVPGPPTPPPIQA